jgi:type II secretory pathway component GspD/PulD (secretin)
VGAFLLPWVDMIRADEPAVVGAVHREPSPLEARIEQAMTGPVEFEFIETPINDVAAFIADSFGIPVYLDRKALEDAGITPDDPVTFQSREVKLESALNLMLGQLELDYAIENEVLLISTQEELNSTLDTRVYPVADLTSIGESIDGGEVDGTKSLMRLIRHSIAVNSWDEVGGPGSLMASPSKNALVCVQTWGNHRKIERLLNDLRQALRQQPIQQATTPAANDLILRFYRVSWQKAGVLGAAMPNRSPTFDGAYDDALGQFAVDRRDTSLANGSIWEEDLAHAIETTIAPESWKSAGGAASMGVFSGVLLVRQSADVHRQIARLLKELDILTPTVNN